MEAFITLAIGVWQIVVIVLLILLLFGGRKIPELMRGVGQGMQEFKKATFCCIDNCQLWTGAESKVPGECLGQTTDPGPDRSAQQHCTSTTD